MRNLMEQATEQVLGRMREQGYWRRLYDENGKHKGFEVTHEDPTAWDINDGWCEEWANRVLGLVPGAEAWWVDQLLPDSEIAHVVILYEGRYYDAERPDGVERLEDLPIFAQKPRYEALV